MQYVTVNDVELAYEIIGQGEPVLLIHGGWMGDAFVPMLDEPALDGYMLINYHRRGYGRSGDYRGQTIYKQQASDALGLMGELDIPKAHIVGHSFGGGIALQMAMDSPDSVATMVLLEGAMPRIVEVERPAGRRGPPGNTPVERGNSVMSDMVGENWQELLEPAIPDVTEQVARGAVTMEQEGQMNFDRATPEDYQRIQQPVLWVSGDQPLSFLLSYVPDELSSVVPHVDFSEVSGVGHGLQMVRPEPVAELIAAWLEEHPLQ